MPDEVFCNEDDVIAGMTLTFDGQLAFATELGNLFVISADANPDDLGDIPLVSANTDCDTASPEELEIVSNSVAADENRGLTNRLGSGDEKLQVGVEQPRHQRSERDPEHQRDREAGVRSRAAGGAVGARGR